jgi:hypothetical protein
MKRFIIIVIVLAVCASGYLLYKKSKEIRGDADNYKTVSIQIKPNVFYRVYVPEEAQLLRSNYESTYQFDLLEVNKYDALPKIYDIEKEVEGAHIVANSKKNILAATLKGFDKESTYTSYVDWESKVYAEGTPSIPILPEGAIQQSNSTFTPEAIADTVLADTAVVLYADDGFLQSAVMFADYQRAVEAMAAKFSGAFFSNFIEYYHQDGVFFAESGDFYIGVRHVNKNTQYTISGKGASLFPYFMNSLYHGGSPVGNGGDITLIPKGTIENVPDQ